jgi:fucose permease
VPRRSSRIVIVLAFVAFVSLGLPDCVLGVAWPSIRLEFGQPLSRLGYLLVGGSGGYLVSGFFAGQIVRKVGVGGLLVGSCLVVVASLVGYWAAPAWGVVVAAAVVGGLGAGAIDAGINTFAASHFSPRVVNWLHASWGIGASAGPLLMTAVLATHHGWRLGYGILAGVMVGLSMLFLLTSGLWRSGGEAVSAVSHDVAPLGEALRQPMVWARALVFFVYGGLEATAGQLLYTLFTEARGIPVAAAGVTVGGYWAALTVGRVVFGQLAASVGRRTVLRIGMLLAIIATVLIAWNPAAAVSFVGVGLLGFALAPVFPTLISGTPEAVGTRHAPHAVGFQIAAGSLGIGVFPGLVGVVARYAGLESIGVYLIGAAGVLLGLYEVTERMGAKARCARGPAQERPANVVTPA